MFYSSLKFPLLCTVTQDQKYLPCIVCGVVLVYSITRPGVPTLRCVWCRSGAP